MLVFIADLLVVVGFVAGIVSIILACMHGTQGPREALRFASAAVTFIVLGPRAALHAAERLICGKVNNLR